MGLKLFATLAVTSALLTNTVEAQPYRVASVNGPALVNCGAGRRPVVRHVRIDGRSTERVTCVSTTRYAPAAQRRVAKHRSWKKSALVIGGSTAGGAGIGALVGGKKGALIGAAAGGGAGTVYEVHKRHKGRRHRR
jgi:hypothetical protein